MVELLNLGSDEYDANDMKVALPHLQQAEAALLKVSGAHSPVTQAARIALANALSDMGRNDEALAMIQGVDPEAYQATTSAPGRSQVLKAIQARIELRLHRPGAETRLRDAIIAMQAAGASDNDIATFRKALPQSGAH